MPYNLVHHTPDNRVIRVPNNRPSPAQAALIDPLYPFEHRWMTRGEARQFFRQLATMTVGTPLRHAVSGYAATVVAVGNKFRMAAEDVFVFRGRNVRVISVQVNGSYALFTSRGKYVGTVEPGRIAAADAAATKALHEGAIHGAQRRSHA